MIAALLVSACMASSVPTPTPTWSWCNYPPKDLYHRDHGDKCEHEWAFECLTNDEQQMFKCRLCPRWATQPKAKPYPYTTAEVQKLQKDLDHLAIVEAQWTAEAKISPTPTVLTIAELERQIRLYQTGSVSLPGTPLVWLVSATPTFSPSRRKEATCVNIGHRWEGGDQGYWRVTLDPEGVRDMGGVDVRRCERCDLWGTPWWRVPLDKDPTSEEICLAQGHRWGTRLTWRIIIGPPDEETKEFRFCRRCSLLKGGR